MERQHSKINIRSNLFLSDFIETQYIIHPIEGHDSMLFFLYLWDYRTITQWKFTFTEQCFF